MLAVTVVRERSTHPAPITIGVRPALSFEAFYVANERRLFRALFVLTGSRDQAEDLTQQAFCRVWERWGRSRCGPSRQKPSCAASSPVQPCWQKRVVWRLRNPARSLTYAVPPNIVRTW